MSHLIRSVLIGAAALTGSGVAAAAADEGQIASAFEVGVVLKSELKLTVVRAATSMFGMKPLEAGALERARGGADVFNDMQLKGVVADNRAINVSTGNNAISDGAFSGMAGLPMVVQNTGNNVLIQNATIISVQVK
jgi:hypothetical protein